MKRKICVKSRGERRERKRDDCGVNVFAKWLCIKEQSGRTHCMGASKPATWKSWTRPIFTQFPYKEQSSIASHQVVDSAGASSSTCIPLLQYAMTTDSYQRCEPEAEMLWALTWHVPPSPGEIRVTHLKPWVYHMNMCGSLGGSCLLIIIIDINHMGFSIYIYIMIRE